MKAVGYSERGSIDRDDALVDIKLPKPEASGRDLLVRIKAIGVNAVDYKIRTWMSAPHGEHRVLGWDAVGIVVDKGPLAEGLRGRRPRILCGHAGPPGHECGVSPY